MFPPRISVALTAVVDPDAEDVSVNVADTPLIRAPVIFALVAPPQFDIDRLPLKVREALAMVRFVPSVVTPEIPPKEPELLYWTWVKDPPGEPDAAATQDVTPEPFVERT